MSQSLRAEEAGDWGFGFELVSFQVTDMLLGELTITRNLLTLERAVSPRSVKAPDVETSE